VDFSGKTAVVAGGTGGLGRAVSLAFLRAGANVVVTFRNPDEFAALQDTAGAARSRLTGHGVDVTDAAVVNEFIETVLALDRHLDILVNTVGGYTGGAKLWEAEPSALDRMLALNLRAGFVLSRAVVPVMLKQGSGAIVNIAAKAALSPAPGGAVYAASKAAALAMMVALAAEVKGTGVRVNTILPSIIDTAANRRSMPKADFSKWPTPEGIARVILFLCSDDAKVIHGAAIPVYGDS